MVEKSLWELLWDYDPNGLVVLDRDYKIQIVNPSFCGLFKLKEEEIKGRPAAEVFDDLSDFEAVWERGEVIKGREREYPRYGLYLRGVYFPVVGQGLAACILVDLTKEHQRAEELREVKQELSKQVNKVIDKQMSIAQEIAGLLGETTAEAKVSLLKIRNMLDSEIR
ncbi:protein containg PAS domain S-box [Longilinea arvoryzae]|uniref:Protein containg PAS domain S-box n=1 Tax=Longilinea arvoryzae TaxID=360412 RepID=A0A0K8MXH0_9CHLR|nr:PAS domain-containing protein [Longilinea arvoryzae]GAP15944.1 protein containg PAS domain S-box [Longilinea arvoryzae]